MLQLKRKESAFTLIELLVVVIIVAVLAAVGVPLLSANVERARLTEADAGLGAIRTAVRAYAVEFNTLPSGSNPETIANLGFNAGDVDGQFFSSEAYTITPDVVDGTQTGTYCISVAGDASVQATSSGAPKVAGLERSMDETGTIWKNSLSCS